MANFFKIILFLIIVVGIGIYFYSQSPNVFQGTPQEKNLAPSQSSKAYTSPSYSPFPTTISQPSSPASSPSIPDSSIPAGFTRGQLSPYFQKIRIGSAYSYSFGNYPAQIKLYSSLSKDEKIDITGWRIKSNHKEIIIPQAYNIS